MAKTSTLKNAAESNENAPSIGVSKRLKKRRFLTFDGGIIPRAENAHVLNPIVNYRSKSKNLDLSLFSKKKRRAKRVSQKANSLKHPDLGKPIDWDKLDATGLPQVTFTPDDNQRARWLILLVEEDVRRLTVIERKLKKQLEKKFQTAFIRIYETYRRMHMRELGWESAHNYGVLPGERKYALKAAAACLSKCVTPRQVLEYWHSHIGDFANSGMTVPPLTFLSQPANVDTVAISRMAKKHGESSDRHAKLERSRHTMSDTSLLHRGLRRELMGAGFDLSDFNDKFLATIQAYAIDVVSGNTEVKFIPNRLREMVKWAAENTFDGVDVDEYI